MSERTPESPGTLGVRGRPAVWSDKGERQRQHRARQAEKLRLLDALLDAVRDARWQDAELHRLTQHGSDAELLQALTEHYRQRHWCRVREAGPEEGGLMPSI
jgi:hypothetical protein